MAYLQVEVEEEELDKETGIVFADMGTRVRLAFDPHRISESAALTMLSAFVPRCADGIVVVHRATT